MSLKNRDERQRGRYVGGSYTPAGGFGTKSFRRKRRSIAGPILIACAVLAVLVAADQLLNAGRIYRGVEVGDVALGGSTPAEAHQIVQERATGAVKEIQLSDPDRQLTRTSKEMGVRFNVDATVDEAYAVGREGNILERLGERARALVVGVTVPADVDYRPGKARAEVEEIASQINHDPREATVRIVGSQVEVADSKEGYELDVGATMRSVGAAVEDLSGQARLIGDVLEPSITTAEAETAAEKARRAVSEQLVFNAEGESWTLSPADIGSSLDVTTDKGKIEITLSRERLQESLAHVYADLNIKPVEASYEFGSGGGIIVTQSKEGQKIEEDKFLGAIEDGLFEGKREYDVPITVDKPTYTTAELQSMKPTELQGSYRTNYRATTDQGQTRVENLQIASAALSGTFVAPGETFSMLEHVAGLDYHETHVIIDGAETFDEGGGLCQVTSTLYNAALYAGMEVVERTAHASQLPYIRPGMDATVWYGDLATTADDLDMKFKNTTDGYVLIEEYVAGDGYIYANVYGVPDKVEVEMSSEEVWMTQDASEWTTYYTRMENGEVVYEDQWNTEYDALIDDKGKKIPTPRVPIAEIDGTYLGPSF
ncbi:MAG TPA: peptidoglycan binding domain-containing protein [Rubrobacteraceae bacterium]|nr:peptidoglycan binding domain-containing protein [Rubrobacteraceae bacterium]